MGNNIILTMKSFAFATLAAAVTALSNTEFEYMQYVAKFNKASNSVDEFAMRLTNFQETSDFITEQNESNDTHVAGHNQFSDWTFAEYKAILGYRRSESNTKDRVQIFDETNASSVNWVTAGAVGAVKDQGQCGSCWAFSSTGSLEGAHFIATGELLSFSEQQLVDCAYRKYGNYACNGGLQTNAYHYYEAGNDAELESVYPYAGKKQSCQYDSLSKTAVTVSIEADKRVFQTYKSGVLSGSKCGTSLDHAVLAVGFGNDSASGLDYWLVKNSWNTVWGDQGYIKLAMDSSAGTCGVQIDPQAPTTN